MKPLFAQFLSVGLLLNLTACSSLSGFFPDKEKDYQLSTELPPLKIPVEITSKGLIKSQPNQQLAEDRETVAVMGEIVKEAPRVGASLSTMKVEGQEKSKDVHVELVKFSTAETRLQINQSVTMTWRMVSKALSRQGIEITARNQDEGEFVVQYDPNGTDFKDESFWDEISFVFSEDHNQEKSYVIKVLAHDNLSEIVVLDEQKKLLSEGAGLSLLKLLATTLQANLADK